MTIVDLLDEDEYEEAIKQLDRRNRQYTKADEMTPYVKAAAHYPPVLEHLAEKHLYVMPSDELRRRQKETIALATSMINACKYCITAHAKVLTEMFDVTDRELVEIATAAGHVAAAIRLEQSLLGGETPLFELRSPDEVPLLSEIEETLGVLPEYYRVVANDETYLEFVWEQERRLLLSGDVDRVDKEYVALAVAIATGAASVARQHKRRLVELGESDSAIFEAVQVVETFTQNNVFTTGLQLETGPWGDD